MFFVPFLYFTTTHSCYSYVSSHFFVLDSVLQVVLKQVKVDVLWYIFCYSVTWPLDLTPR